MMSEQEQKVKKTSTAKDEQTPPERSEESKAKTDRVRQETDDLLDAIDELMPESEAEAQAFVNQYIQKGGE